jgi:hypothetical protein
MLLNFFTFESILFSWARRLNPFAESEDKTKYLLAQFLKATVNTRAPEYTIY